MEGGFGGLSGLLDPWESGDPTGAMFLNQRLSAGGGLPVGDIYRHFDPCGCKGVTSI